MRWKRCGQCAWNRLHLSGSSSPSSLGSWTSTSPGQRFGLLASYKHPFFVFLEIRCLEGRIVLSFARAEEGNDAASLPGPEPSHIHRYQSRPPFCRRRSPGLVLDLLLHHLFHVMRMLFVMRMMMISD